MANKTKEQLDAEYVESLEKQWEDSKLTSAANYDFFNATLTARRYVKENLPASRDKYGDLKYNVQQGLTAACHAREDAMATLLIQKTLLERLDNLRILLWICIGILVYIAVRIY